MNEAAAVEDPAQARLERPVKAVSFGLKLRIGPKSLGQFTLASSPGRPLFAWRVFPRKLNYHGRRASRLAATPCLYRPAAASPIRLFNRGIANCSSGIANRAV